MDSGTYRCIAQNELGHISATAILGVLPPGKRYTLSCNGPHINTSCPITFIYNLFFLFYSDEMSAYVEQNMNEMMGYDQLQDYDRDYY